MGTVIKDRGNGEVTGITYTAHKKLASKLLQKLEEEVGKKIPDSSCRIVHRLGYLKLGEVSIAIVIRTPHRKEAYKMSRFIIDKVKKTIPIWKKEHFKNGKEKWVIGKKLERIDYERCK